MGWDYNQFMSQPQWFIDLVSVRKSVEADAAAREQRKKEAKFRRNG